MFNELVLVNVTKFNGSNTPDKNGLLPVMLQCIAGKMPNRNVLSGTMASENGFEIGKSYLVNIRECGFDIDFGTDFTFVNLKEVTTSSDIILSAKELGTAEIIIFDKPEGFKENYDRKTNAVEGIRQKRIKDGKYLPSSNNINDHSNAKIVPGKSINDNQANLN
jgi:hypothetical protein